MTVNGSVSLCAFKKRSEDRVGRYELLNAFLWRCFTNNAIDFYFGCTQFESITGHQRHWLGFPWFFAVTPFKCRDFISIRLLSLPDPPQSIILHRFFIQRCIVWIQQYGSIVEYVAKVPNPLILNLTVCGGEWLAIFTPRSLSHAPTWRTRQCAISLMLWSNNNNELGT
jgi:hypothetical protein